MNILSNKKSDNEADFLKRVRVILWFCIAFVIRRLRMTCGTCRNRKEFECGIVCDHCARTQGIYQLGNIETYFCGSYKPRM